tara:strand:- start:358 stop:900 length:543 start_codon:yes stop_codon:yes gene_type:complete
MAKKNFLNSLLNFKPEHYLVVIVILALFLVFRPDCMLLEGQRNRTEMGATEGTTEEILDILEDIGKEPDVNTCFVDKQKVLSIKLREGEYDDFGGRSGWKYERERNQGLLDCLGVQVGGLTDAIGTTASPMNRAGPDARRAVRNVGADAIKARQQMYGDNDENKGENKNKNENNSKGGRR